MPIKLHFEKISRFDRPAEPCSVAVPFAAGELSDGEPVAVFDDRGAAVPTQSRATAHWPDGSVKWLLVHVLADLPANAAKTFELRPGAGPPAPPEPPAPVAVNDASGAVSIATGSFTAELGAPGGRLFRGLTLGEFGLMEDEIEGPSVTASSGETFTARVGPGGWELVEAGPVRACCRTRGRHSVAGGPEWLDFEARVYAWASKSWVRLDYRIINREHGNEITLESVRFAAKPLVFDTSGVRTALATSNYRSSIRRGEGKERLAHTIDADFLLYDANEQIPEVNYGTFWADWTHRGSEGGDEGGGFAVTLHQAYQNFPKRLTASGEGAAAELVPAGTGGLRMLRGMAKTHRLYIHLHGPDATPEELNVRSLQFQMPDRAALEPGAFRRAGVCEDVFVDEPVPRVERYLADLADRRVRGYGVLHWGDGPDMSYTEQGRGRGDLVWTNGEYDLAHAAWLSYARTAGRRMLDYMLVAAEHWMDVDVCHSSDDPMREGGQVVHSARHVTGFVTPSHEWVEGLLDYFHATGEAVALDTAVGIAENVLRQLDGRPELRKAAGSAARETGWALRTLVAMYVETHDERWMAPAEMIVSQFEAWADEYGAWLAPYTDHTLARVPFMIAIAASSLTRYWRVRPTGRVAAMITSSMDDLLEHCLTTDGRFYYKELPSLRQRAAGTYVLESLACAYEISGDTRYLDAGITTFELAVSVTARGNVVGRKYVSADAVIWEAGASPKAFAANFTPVTAFYRAAVSAGVLA